MKFDRNGEIAKRAHAIWEATGRPDGQAEQHWLQAEREVEAGNDNDAVTSSDAAMPAPAAKGNAAKVAKTTSSRKPATPKKPASAGARKQTARA